MAPVTADFGPSSVLIQGQNAPLREHPVPLPADKESILDKPEFSVQCLQNPKLGTVNREHGTFELI